MTESRIKNTEYVWFRVTNQTQGVEKMKGLDSCWTGHRFFLEPPSCFPDVGPAHQTQETLSFWVQVDYNYHFSLFSNVSLSSFGSHVLYIHFLTSHSHLRNVLFSLARPRFTPDIEMSFLWISHTVNEAEKFYLTEYEDKVGKLWSPKE